MMTPPSLKHREPSSGREAGVQIVRRPAGAVSVAVALMSLSLLTPMIGLSGLIWNDWHAAGGATIDPILVALLVFLLSLSPLVSLGISVLMTQGHASLRTLGSILSEAAHPLPHGRALLAGSSIALPVLVLFFGLALREALNRISFL